MQVETSKNLKFVSRLEKLRLTKGWTWQKVAHEIGLSTTMIHFIKKGKHNVTDKVFYRLEQAEVAAGIAAENNPEKSSLSSGTKSRIREALNSLPQNERKQFEDLWESRRQDFFLRADRFKVTAADLKRGYMEIPLEFRVGNPPQGSPKKLCISAIGSLAAAKLLPQISAKKVAAEDIFLLSIPEEFRNDTFLNQLTPTCISSMICVAMLLNYGLSEGRKILISLEYKFAGN